MNICSFIPGLISGGAVKVAAGRGRNRWGGGQTPLPLTSGAYLSLRTTSTQTNFDNIAAASQTKYYYHGGKRVVMRAGSTLYYLFGDHPGSRGVSLRASDGNTLTQRYYPWGTIRPGLDNGLPTDYTFTGQRRERASNPPLLPSVAPASSGTPSTTACPPSCTT